MALQIIYDVMNLMAHVKKVIANVRNLMANWRELDGYLEGISG